MALPVASFRPGEARPGYANPGNPGGTPPAGSVPWQGGGGGGLVVVNQWPVTAQNTYGLAQVKVSNTAGNALIAILGCGASGQIVVPRFNVADDGHSRWTYCGSSLLQNPGTNRRLDVWVAPNANADSFVSVATSWFTSGVAGVILEVSGFPTYAQVDFIAAATPTGGTTVTVNGTATGADIVFGGLLLSQPGSAIPVTGPAGFTPLNTVNSGSSSTDMTSEVLYPVWETTGAGPVSATWSWTGSERFSAILVGFSQSPAAPFQPNPNWPAFKIEAGFGWQPGNLAGTMPTRTDITTRAIDAEGMVILKTKAGRPYELTQPEAGENAITLDNSDGAFNPQNTGSPFYPFVLPEVPVWATAWWQGKAYPIASFLADKWPQAFPDPQYGTSPLEGTDGIGAASQISLPSAYAGEVLLDTPIVYFPLGEFYSPAAGLRFANLSRTNLKPAYGIDDTARSAGVALTTGIAINLAGDPATGIGTSAISVYGTNGGPGALYVDPTLPPLASGFALEFWGSVPAAVGANYVPLLTVAGVPSSYGNVLGNGVRLQVALNATLMAVNMAGFTGAAGVGLTGLTLPILPQAICHYVVTVVNNAGTWTLTVYQNGVQVGQSTGATPASSIDASMLLIGPVALNGAVLGGYNYTIGQVAAYGYQLDPLRILRHYNAGAAAFSGQTAIERYGRLLAWSGAQLPAAASPPSPGPLIGNADQVQGQAISDSAYNLTVDEGGMYYCDKAGNQWYMARSQFYNRPSKFTFGDNPGETPYSTMSGFDFDNTFLYNITSSQRTTAVSQAVITAGNPAGQASTVGTASYGVTATEADLASEAQYMPRGPLQQGIETTSDQDAYDRATWSLNKYKQPQVRATQIQLDPASEPAAWPVALGIEQGDIVTVNRRPLGAAPISVRCIVQSVQHDIGPSHWLTTLALAPYFPENAVIQLDNPPFNTPSSGALPW